MHDFSIRLARANARDAAGICAIYSPFVWDTAVTFEYDPPTVDTFISRIAEFSTQYPYLVSERAGRVSGYAYASKYMERAAYAWGVQVSVYVAPEVRGEGDARGLYESLLTLLTEQGYRTAYAIITQPNERSMRFHASFGFVPAGVHHKAGYKLGAWHDVAWMEKPLGSFGPNPEPPRPVSALPESVLARALF